MKPIFFAILLSTLSTWLYKHATTRACPTISSSLLKQMNSLKSLKIEPPARIPQEPHRNGK